MQSFYDRPTACVKMNWCLSQEFVIERGVRQGFVPSPHFFLHSFLQRLKEANEEVMFEGVYMGPLTNTDDLHV